MVTLIILDTSSLMDVKIKRGKIGTYSPLQFTLSSLHTFLDELKNTSKFEMVGIAICCPEAKIVCPFTRDYDKIKDNLKLIESGHEFNLYNCLKEIQSLLLNEWPMNEKFTIIAIYDALTVERLNEHKIGVELSLCGRLLLLGLQDGNESDYKEITPNLKASYLDITLLQPTLPITEVTLMQFFSVIVENHYQPFLAQLNCGNLESKIIVWPKPEQFDCFRDLECKVYYPKQQIEIVGFLDNSTLGCPGIISRHFIYPWLPSMAFSVYRDLVESRLIADENQDRDTPSFLVLLHGALKLENISAICLISDDWFGALCSYSDLKKKSNLSLQLFHPGRFSVPWLGDLNALTIPSISSTDDCFPTISQENNLQQFLVFVKQPQLQSELKKILRYVNKMPEKTQQFYNKINKLRQGAICIGFLSLLEGLANLLDRECRLLPGSAHPASAIQLSHAASLLREPCSLDLNYTLMPLPMSF